MKNWNCWEMEGSSLANIWWNCLIVLWFFLSRVLEKLWRLRFEETIIFIWLEAVQKVCNASENLLILVYIFQIDLRKTTRNNEIIQNLANTFKNICKLDIKNRSEWFESYVFHG